METRKKPHLKHLIRPHTSDYTQTIDHVGICEVNGNSRHRIQEDAVAIDVTDASEYFIALPAKQRKRIAASVFSVLQKRLADAHLFSRIGSCVCLATGQVNEGKAVVSTSYVGDSVAFLVVLKADGTLKSVNPCNPALHDGYNILECSAIHGGVNRSKGFMTSDSGTPRLHGELAVTRALGDTRFDNKGISHVPETTTVEVNVDADDRVYMVVTCDGAMEHCKGEDSVATYADQLGKLFAENPIASPEILAEKIVDHALSQKSLDNITAMVVPLEKGKAVTAGVFDGHGGPHVAHFLRDNLIDVFKKKVIRPPDKPIFFSKWIAPVRARIKDSASAIGLGCQFGFILGAFLGSAVFPAIGTIGGAFLGSLVCSAAGMGLDQTLGWIRQKSIQPPFVPLREPIESEETMTPSRSSVAQVSRELGFSILDHDHKAEEKPLLSDKAYDQPSDATSPRSFKINR